MTNPNEAADKFIEGIQLLRAGEYEDAIVRLSEAIELKPDGYYYRSRAEAYRQLGKEEEAQADSEAANRILSEVEGRIYQQSRALPQATEGISNGHAELRVMGLYAIVLILPPLFLLAAWSIVWSPEPDGRWVAPMPGGMGLLLGLFIPNAVRHAINNPVSIRGTVEGERS